MLLEAGLDLRVSTLLAVWTSLVALPSIESLCTLREFAFLVVGGDAQTRLGQRQMLRCLDKRCPAEVIEAHLFLHWCTCSPCVTEGLRDAWGDQVRSPCGVEATLGPLGAADELFEFENIRLDGVVGGRVDVQVKLILVVEHVQVARGESLALLGLGQVGLALGVRSLVDL